MGDKPYGFDPARLVLYAEEIKKAVELKIQVAIVIGGGNIFRGLKGNNFGVERVQGDYMGMLATVINGLALQSALESAGVKSKVLSGVKIDPVCELTSGRKAIDYLESGYDTLSFTMALEKELCILDLTAFALCKENNMPLVVFDMNKEGNLLKLMQGENVGTFVSN